MRIVIISDIHDNIINLKKCLDYCNAEKIKNLICCGDVTNSETINILAENFLGIIHLVRGNIEIYHEEEIERYKNIIYYGRVGRFELDGKYIGLCHEPFLENYVLKKGECDIIFYGHTHKPWLEKRSGYIFVNPGTLGGVFEKACFAVWDTDEKEPELKVLENI